jgi:DUF917 family protein
VAGLDLGLSSAGAAIIGSGGGGSPAAGQKDLAFPRQGHRIGGLPGR